jgi:hypothetical protein
MLGWTNFFPNLAFRQSSFFVFYIQKLWITFYLTILGNSNNIKYTVKSSREELDNVFDNEYSKKQLFSETSQFCFLKN